MKRIATKTILLTGFLALALSGTAFSHEFIVKPVQTHPSPGQTLPFSVVSAHVFMSSEEMEPVDRVSVQLLKGEGNEDISLAENETLMTLDGAAKIPGDGTCILAGHREGMIWTQTAQGWKQASKKGLSGVISSGQYEKFCKTLVTAGAADDGYKTVVGHALEIVPEDNPAGVRPGDEAAFRVLYEGKPLSTEVRATCDGFSSRPNTYAYLTETDETGVAHVRIDRAGLWMIRAEHKIDEPTEDYDTRVIRSVLVFDVR